jgi:polyisoprenyl-teichoic acid--peptidoglycan teichoic acid transferase
MRNPFKRKKGRHSLENKYAAVFRSQRERPHRFAWLRRKWVLIGLVVLLLLGAGAGYGLYLYYDLQGDIQDEGIRLPPPPFAVEGGPPLPFNVLLIGSDSREGLTEEEQQRLGAEEVAGERADTLIIGHIDPGNGHVTMVQFPRDLYVPTADGGHSKINETLDRGDNFLIETVEEVTGLDFHHYAKVNIAGFRDLVDEIGGVEVCIAEPIPFDPQTGIEVTPEEVGMVEFSGDRALRFVRSRNYVTGDFQRIQNQQKFLAAAIDELTSVETFLRIDRIKGVMEVARENVTIDRGTTIKGLLDILQRFRAFNPDNEDYEAYTVPNLGTGSVDVGGGELSSVVQPDVPAMKLMFEAIEENESPGEADGVPDISTSKITVAVLNGTKEDGAADRAAGELQTATTTADGPVGVETIADAPRQNYKNTVVLHRGGETDEDKAELVSAALPGSKIEEGKVPAGNGVAVIVGKRFETKHITQIVPIPIPKPAELPEECR